MFSLQLLLGKKDKFFDLLEASAQEARTSVEALVKLIANPTQTTLSYDFVQSRRKEKELRGQISELVYTTFVTSLEREDIERSVRRSLPNSQNGRKVRQPAASDATTCSGRRFHQANSIAGRGDGDGLGNGAKPSARCEPGGNPPP